MGDVNQIIQIINMSISTRDATGGNQYSVLRSCNSCHKIDFLLNSSQEPAILILLNSENTGQL